MKNTTVILADDHHMVRKSFSLLIKEIGGYNIIAEAANGEEVVEHLKSRRIPQVLLLDISMPRMNGYDTVKYISQNFPQVNILILTMYDTDFLFTKLIESGPLHNIIFHLAIFIILFAAEKKEIDKNIYFPTPKLHL
jgi:DNA-binding NarL/FixJ family response regulator